MNYKFLLLLCFTLFASCWAGATDTPVDGETETRKSEVTGGVHNNETKKPLQSVIVTAYSSSKKEKVVLSDAQGNFSFDDLKPGTYKFVFQKEGFKKVIREKTISRVDEGQQLNILMEEHEVFDFTPGSSHFFDF